MAPADQLAAVRHTLASLVEAARVGDRSAFAGLVSDRDPTFASRARLLYANLSTLPLTALSLTPESDRQPVPPARRAVLGESAWVQPVVVEWRLSGDDQPALHRVWLTFVPGSDGVRVAGTFDGPRPQQPDQQPSWWLGLVTARRAGPVTVVAGSGQDPDRWLGLAGPAVGAVRRDLPPGVAAGWPGRVVLEVPASPADFAAVLGQPPERYAATAAVAYEAGNGDRAPLRVVVNPRAGTLPADQRAELLRHELVHVATRSPVSPAPLWAVEGMAEWVALRGRSGATSAGTPELLAAVRRDGPPRSLPADARFAVGGSGLDRVYAEAWLAARFVAETYGPARWGRVYADLDRGRTVDEATRAVLGTGAAALTAGWRRFLVRQAGAR